MKNIIKNAIILTLITLIAGTALSIVYSVTKKPIELAELKATQEAYKKVFVAADEFQKLDVKDFQDKNNSSISAVSAAKSNGEIVGYVMTTASKGYGGDIKLALGIDLQGKLTGISILDASNETPGLGARVTEDEFVLQFKGINSDSLDSVDAVSGATYSTNGVKNAVQAGLNYYLDNLQKGDD